MTTVDFFVKKAVDSIRRKINTFLLYLEGEKKKKYEEGNELLRFLIPLGAHELALGIYEITSTTTYVRIEQQLKEYFPQIDQCFVSVSPLNNAKHAKHDKATHGIYVIVHYIFDNQYTLDYERASEDVVIAILHHIEEFVITSSTFPEVCILWFFNMIEIKSLFDADFTNKRTIPKHSMLLLKEMFTRHMPSYGLVELTNQKIRFSVLPYQKIINQCLSLDSSMRDKIRKVK